MKQNKIVKIILLLNLFCLIGCVVVLFVQSLNLMRPPQICGIKDIYCILNDENLILLDKVSAKDAYGADISQNIKVDLSQVDWERAGRYCIKYSVIDRNLKERIEYGNLIILPSYPYFIGESEIYCIKDAIADFSNIKAFDAFHKPIEDIVIPNYNTGFLGEQKITITATDDYGFSNTIDVDLFIIENYLPTFKGIDFFEYTIGFGWKNLFENVKAYDYRGRDITENIVVDSSRILYKVVGEYPVLFSVIDAEGHRNNKIEYVQVKEIDKELYPQIIGIKEEIILEIGSDEPDWLDGVNAFDITDGDLTNIIEVYSDLNVHKIGEYRVNYYVKNSKGLSFEDFIIVQIVAPNVDITPPEIFGVLDILIYEIPEDSADIDKSFYRDGVSVMDDFDGDITEFLEIRDEGVDYSKPGEYYVYYYAKDNSDNSAWEEVVVIVKDEIPPKFYGLPLESGWTVNVGENEPNYQFGVVAIDNVDGDLTDRINIANDEIDYTKAGEYTIIYSVIDSSGNENQQKVSVIVLDS